eukprot:m.307605 g.307605  ORF g.307605 m.307605 type:complete len:786 (+) comp42516_c0_seq1:80-2437(+)
MITVFCLISFLSAVKAHSLATFPQSVDCQSEPQKNYKMCNSSLTPEERASDLVSRLSIDEAIQQTWSIAPAIPNLGIKPYNWRSNCLHGWSASGGHWDSSMKWTVFPSPMNLGATFDTDLVLKVGQATADEGRALHNLMLAKNNGTSTEAAALNCFSPNVNLLRDPRWGRAEETFGEDPFVLSQIGVAYTRGLQEGESPHYVKVVACAKHYAVHSGRDNDRSHFIANTSMHDLYDTYLPAFKSQIIGAKVGQIMPAYSSVRCKGSPDGAPDCANTFLLRTVLRDQFGGHNVSVCSDNGGVAEVYATHHYVPTAEDAAAVSMKASTDLDLGYDAIYSKYLGPAVKDGKVDAKTIQESVWRSFYWRIRLGDFDPPSMVPYQSIGGDHLNTEENQQLNLLSARKSIVLLKNEDGTLPLKANLKKVAVIGPNANDENVLLSNYPGNAASVTTVLAGIKAAVSADTQVVNASGCKDVKCSTKEGFDEAVQAAKDADVAIMVLGLSGSLEGEGHDRDPTRCELTTLDVIGLPGCQHSLVQAIAATKVPIVLVLINGGPVSTPWEKENIPAIIDAFYPGAVGGQAVADVLFGKYNPAGRMPVTTYMGDKDLPPVENYNMSFPPGRTYKYYTGTPLYPFGFGLSYTTFQYMNLSTSASSVNICDSVTISALVNNTGQMDGEEVVQLYLSFSPVSPLNYSIPLRILVGFQRVSIKAGASTQVKFSIDPYDMTVVNEGGERVLNAGSFMVYIGGQQPVPGSSGILNTTFTLNGTLGEENINSCPHAKKCMACPIQ